MTSTKRPRNPLSPDEERLLSYMRKFTLGRYEKMLILLKIHEKMSLNEIATFLQLTRARVDEIVASLLCRAKASEAEHIKQKRLADNDRRIQLRAKADEAEHTKQKRLAENDRRRQLRAKRRAKRKRKGSATK